MTGTLFKRSISMVFFAVMLSIGVFATSTHAQSYWNEGDFGQWLKEPGVRVLAVQFFEPENAQHPDIVQNWRKLMAAYRDHGLYLVGVVLERDGQCPELDFLTDRLVCDDGTLLKRWFVSGAESFAFSWQGHLLLSHGDTEALNRAIVAYFSLEQRWLLLDAEAGERAALNAAETMNIQSTLKEQFNRLSKQPLIDGGEAADTWRSLLERGLNGALSTYDVCGGHAALGRSTLIVPRVVPNDDRRRLSLSAYHLGRGCLISEARIVFEPENARTFARDISEAFSELMRPIHSHITWPGAGGAYVWKASPEATDTVALRLDTQPQGARAFIDAEPLCAATPCISMQKPREAEIRFELARHDSYRQRVRVGQEHVRALNVRLVPDFGTLTVASLPPGVPVFVNQEPRGETPLVLELAPGEYRIRMGDAAWETFETDITIQKTANERLYRDMVRRTGRVRLHLISTPPGESRADIWLDGKRIGHSGESITLPIGDQHLVLKAGNGRAELDLRVVENALVEKTVRLTWTPDIEWRRLPGGSFDMGASLYARNERPVHGVTLPPFSIMRHEVTVQQYRACENTGACSRAFKGGDCNDGLLTADDFPINCVNWEQAHAFCAWVGGRLPSESEWEYAATSGRRSTYPWEGRAVDCSYAVMDDGGAGCGQYRSWPVCSKPKGHSFWGLCDMAGNVAEWVADDYRDSYAFAPFDGSARKGSDEPRKAVRGGSWMMPGWYLRTTARQGVNPKRHDAGIGFRCVKE